MITVGSVFLSFFVSFVLEFIMFKLGFDNIKPSSLICHISNYIHSCFVSIGKFVYDNFEIIRPYLVIIATNIYNFLKNIIENLALIADKIISFFSDIFKYVYDFIKYIFNTFINDILLCFDNLFKSCLNLLFSWLGLLDGILGIQIRLSYETLFVTFILAVLIIVAVYAVKNDGR